jgi:3',5'-cyclic AMP phosphodiesterase CpdA
VNVTPSDSTRLVHLSDLHYGRRFRRDLAEALVACVRALEPKAVIVSGDSTMRARKHQFSAVCGLLSRFSTPLLVIPGNHDIPLYNVIGRMTRPFGNYNRFLGSLSIPSLQLPHVSVLGINTVNPWRHQAGRITPGQLHDIREWFRVQPDSAWRVLVVHQHFFQLKAVRRPGLIKAGAAILSSLSEFGVHAVLGGHVHVSYTGSTREYLPDLTPPVALVYAGTATSARSRASRDRANHFNLIEFCADTFVVTPHFWSDEKDTFEPAAPVEYSRAFFTGNAVAREAECPS